MGTQGYNFTQHYKRACRGPQKLCVALPSNGESALKFANYLNQVALGLLFVNAACSNYSAVDSLTSASVRSASRIGSQSSNLRAATDASGAALTNPFKPFTLNAGASISSGELTLSMQADGNLVLYSSGTALWDTHQLQTFDYNGFTGPTTGLDCTTCYAVFQDDGNLVLVNPNFNGNSAHVYWNSGTSGNSGATLNISSTAPYVSVLNSSGVTLWMGLENATGSLAKILSLPHLNSPTSLAKFSLSEDQGRDMDVMDIAQESDNQFVGVYHNGLGGDKFCLRLATATSINQAVWHYQTDIDCDYGSQGSIKRLPDGKYLVAYEKNESSKRPYIRFVMYDSYAQLIANQSSRSYSIPWNSKANAEGTPNFRWIRYDGNPDTMTVEIGFHYNPKSTGKDINAIGFLRGFKAWDWYDNSNLNALLAPYTAGNIGGRAFIVYQGKPYTLVEAQGAKHDFSTWKLFLYDEQANSIAPIAVTTPSGSAAFGNPKLSYVKSGGNLMIAGTAFSFNNDHGGNHLYATEVASGVGLKLPEVNVTNAPFTSFWNALSLPHQIGYGEFDGWSVAASSGQGYLAYGPYDRSLPNAPMVAVFTYMADNNTDLNIPVVAFEIYDSDTGQIIARNQISRQALPSPYQYGLVGVAFDWRGHAGHAFEARVWSYGVSYLKVQNVRIQEAF